MKTRLTIDKAGRVVIPKPLREELHLEPGDSLEMESAGEQITWRPVRGTGPLMNTPTRCNPHLFEALASIKSAGGRTTLANNWLCRWRPDGGAYRRGVRAGRDYQDHIRSASNIDGKDSL